MKEIYEGLGIALFDQEGQLRSSYEIFSDLADIWNTLDKNTQNYIASQQAGTNQFQTFAALMQNFSTATDATATAINSAGSAARENAAAMEGLEAKTNQVKATFQELANNVIDSELIKSVLDLANAFLQLANTDIGQIATQIGLLTGLLWGGTGLIRAMKLLPVMFSAFATSTTAASGAVTALGIASKSAFPLLFGLSAAIVGVYHGVKWLKSKWDEAHPSVEQLNQDLDEYNAKLQENNARLEELSKIPMSNRTSEINEEVAALKEENAELEKNIGLTSQQAAEKQFLDIAKSDKYSIDRTRVRTYNEDSQYRIYSEDLDSMANSVEEVTRQLEDMDNVSDEIKTKASEINEEFDKTGGILDSSIKNKFDSLIGDLRQEGVFVEEITEGYDTFDSTITQLVDRYDELANKVKNNIDMTADERVEFVDLQGTLTELYNDLDAAKEAHVELDGAQNLVHHRIEQLIPGFEDLSFKVWNLNGEVNAAEYYLGVLSTGMGVNKTQADILSAAYPTLTSYIQENNGMYYLNIEALDNAAKAGDVWAQRLVGQQKQATEAAIKYGNMRLDAMVQEAKAAGKQYGYESDEYKEAKAIADQQLNEIHDAQIALNRLKAGLSSFSYVPTGGIGKTPGIPSPSGSGGKGSTKAAQEENDILEKRKELYQDQLDIMEHQLFLMEKQGRSEKDRIAYMKKIQAYLNEQANWYRRQGETEDSEYIRDLQEQWWKYYDQIKDLQREAFDERLEESENYIDKRNDLDDWGADNEIKAWNRVVKWMDEWYKNGLIDYEYYLKKRTEAVKNAAKAEKEAWKKAQDATISWIEDEIDKLESLFDAVADKAQEEIDALEKQKDAIDEKYQEQIDALEKVNEELENQIALEKALDDLAKARQSKVMVYKDGRFQYVQDIDKVSEAQATVDKLQREEQLRQEIENLKNQRDKEKEILDEKIKYWQDYVDKFGNFVDDYLKKQKLSVKLEGENWERSLKNFKDYVREYEELQRRLQAAQKAQFGVQSKPSGTDWSKMWWDVENDPNLSKAEKDKLQNWIHDQKAQEMAGSGAIYDPKTGTWSGGTGPSSSIEAPPPSSGGSSSSSGISGGLGAIAGAMSGILGGSHANGTLSAPGGISLVGEKGAEMRVLNSGDGIIPAKQTANLWNWGNIAPADFMNQVNRNSGTNVYIDKFNPNLPNVKDGQDFIDYLTRHFVPMVVQAQH